MEKFWTSRCAYCGNGILYYTQVRSLETGAYVPLDPKTYKNHACPSTDNPDTQRRHRMMKSRQKVRTSPFEIK